MLAPLQHHLITLSIPLPALWLRFILVPLAHRGPKANHALQLTPRMHPSPLLRFLPGLWLTPTLLHIPPSRSFPTVLVLSLLILLQPPVPRHRFSSPSLGHGTGGSTSTPLISRTGERDPAGPSRAGLRGPHTSRGGTRAGSCMAEATKRRIKLRLSGWHGDAGCWGSCLGVPGDGTRDSTALPSPG